MTLLLRTTMFKAGLFSVLGKTVGVWRYLRGMKKPIISSWTVVRVALIAGVIYLAANGVDGWGWLVFALLVSFQFD